MITMPRTQAWGATMVLSAWMALVAVPWGTISFQFALPQNVLTILVAALTINYLSRPLIDFLEPKLGVLMRQNSVLRRRFFRERVRHTHWLKWVMLPPVSSIAAGSFLFVLLGFASHSAWKQGAKWYSATSCLLLYSWIVIAILALFDLTAEKRDRQKLIRDGFGPN